MTSSLFGGIEGGGTKFICAVGTGPNDLRAETRFPTTTPDETLGRAIDFFKAQTQSLGPLASIGVASFGPLDPRPESPTYGHILPTPKPGWANADIVGTLNASLDLPIAFDTDVNGAALGEWRWGAAQGLDTFVYLTIGTGIGGGGLINGKLMHGLIHPEMGHIPLPRDAQRDPFKGVCPFHENCFEGLASGPSIEKRWGKRAEELPPEHPAWDLEAHYIALALASYVYVLSPQRIVLGGGVIQQSFLLDKIRSEVQTIINNYVQSPAITKQIENYIVPAALGGRAGVLGAIALAQGI
ncbi:MAG TPA: ROK family protein [Anaerolineales bacterium]|nr:ROK family protein [Anaerolineales bacterium]